MGTIWALLTYRHRRLLPSARVHTSVRLRTQPPLYKERVPDNVVWEDEGWPTQPM
jgi:hypothetical protein